MFTPFHATVRRASATPLLVAEQLDEDYGFTRTWRDASVAFDISPRPSLIFDSV